MGALQTEFQTPVFISQGVAFLLLDNNKHRRQLHRLYRQKKTTNIFLFSTFLGSSLSLKESCRVPVEGLLCSLGCLRGHPAFFCSSGSLAALSDLDLSYESSFPLGFGAAAYQLYQPLPLYLRCVSLLQPFLRCFQDGQGTFTHVPPKGALRNPMGGSASLLVGVYSLIPERSWIKRQAGANIRVLGAEQRNLGRTEAREML